MAARNHDAAVERQVKKRKIHKRRMADADIDNIDARCKQAPHKAVAQAVR